MDARLMVAHCYRNWGSLSETAWYCIGTALSPRNGGLE